MVADKTVFPEKKYNKLKSPVRLQLGEAEGGWEVQVVGEIRIIKNKETRD